MNTNPTKEWLAIYESKTSMLVPPVDLNTYFTSGEVAGKKLDTMSLGDINVTTGAMLVRDPLAYLHKDEKPYWQTVPTGRFPLTACVIIGNEDDCARYAAVKVDLSDSIPIRYEEALIGYEDLENLEQGEYFGFNVDAGLATIVDTATAVAYGSFCEKWEAEHPDSNIYDDYFAGIFDQSYKQNPRYQREGGDWINWTIPDTNFKVPMFQSGLGDGAYPVYFGFDANGAICRLVVQFIDIKLAYSEKEE